MELRHLRYFVAVAEEQSFTRAAERLWTAQPGLSTQIRRLEEELGVKLFARHPRGVEMTDAGKVFLERARAVLTAAEQARATGDDIKAGLVGTIRLGIATGARWSVVSQLLDSFAADYPGVELTVVESHGGTLARDLRDGRLDALVAPSWFSSPELQRTHLGSDRWAVLVGPGHRLGRPGPIAASELGGESIIVTGHRDGVCYDHAVAETLSELGLTAELRRGGPGPALFKPVGDGDALALSTAAAAGSGDVIVRPLEPSRDLSFELVWRDKTPAPALSELIRAARSLADPSPPPAVRLMALAA
jgi:DNA-binding transcriptional LysR family regulator